MKKFVEWKAYAPQILTALETGVLLNTCHGGRMNTMTIGWGSLTREWNRPIFVAYVRESRFSRVLLDETGEFTVSIPLENANREALGYCGRFSGYDRDKIRDLGLTPEEPEATSVPGLREFPLTLECRVLFQKRQDPESLPRDIQDRFYPVISETGRPDAHIAYYGEILSAYIIENQV